MRTKGTFTKGDPRINKKGQPTKEAKLTKTQVRNRAIGMALHGVTYEKIAEHLGVCRVTLAKYLGKDLEEARQQCFSTIAGSMYSQAMNATDPRIKFDNSKFILTHQAKWAPTVKTELTGADGGPIHTLDMSAFTTEELEAIELAQKQAAGRLKESNS